MENHIHRGPDGLHPLQTEWILALCNSVLAPAPAAPPTTHPNMAPRMQTDQPSAGRALQAPRRRQEWSLGPLVSWLHMAKTG